MITTKSFGEIINTEEKVLVKFGASWCGPCKIVDRILDKVKSNGVSNVHKVDVEQNSELGAKFNIRNLPTIIVFKKGKEVSRKIGIVNETEILNLM